MSYIGTSLAHLGNYRVLKTQEVAREGGPDNIYGVHLLALGLRETGLRNINGGGTFVNGTWAPAKTDRGCFQISQKYHSAFLKSVPGCKEGSWWPTDGKTALDEGYCPRFSDAVRYANRTLQLGIEFSHDNHVRSEDRVRFAIAAYNAGLGGALNGYKQGNVDKYTTGGDYSKWVLEKVPEMRTWLNEHPNWKYG